MSGAKPSRSLVIVAGILTQLTGASCLLLGTVAFALTLQGNEHALMPILIGWIAAALSNVVSGGLVYRGNLVCLVIAALLDGVFGVVLLQLRSTLGGLLKMLPGDDVEVVALGLGIMAIGMLVAVLACVIAIPQARRYSAWLDGSDAATTAPGFPPPPVSAHHTAQTPTGLHRTAKRSRRRIGFAIAGLAVGVASGIVVITATASHVDEPSDPTPPTSGKTSSGSDPKAGSADPKAGSADLDGGSADPKAGSADLKAGSAEPRAGSADPKAGSADLKAGSADPKAGSADPKSDVAKTDAGTVDKPAPITTPQDLLIAEHTAIGKGDVHGLAALASPQAFVFGVDASEVAEGRDAIEAIFKHDLGEAPADVDGKYLQLGEWRDHAWIAEELEVGTKAPRRYVITQLAAKIGGRWTVVAWCWAIAVTDNVADHMVVARTMPIPKVIAASHDGPDDLDAAVRAAFASRKAFSDAFSTRDDAFNFGSGPGEHVPGGGNVKRIFARMHADLEIVGGAHVVGGSSWDRSQAAATWIGFGAANIAYRIPGHATQVFRVLAVLIKDPDWKIVQTQFSNGGPI